MAHTLRSRKSAKKRAAPSPELSLLLQMLDEGFKDHAWHGPNLRGSVRGVTADEAAWRPEPNRHNIIEIVLHSAYWKYAVRRRLTGEKRGSFRLTGSNWFVAPGNSRDRETEWREAVEFLQEEHLLLRDVIAHVPSADLGKKTPGGKVTRRRLMYSIAMHDVYHAGQIQLLKRLRRTSGLS